MPAGKGVTINFDSNILKVAYGAENSYTWTTSGETLIGFDWSGVFDVTLNDGYIIDSITTNNVTTVTSQTDTTFQIKDIFTTTAIITITSKQSVPQPTLTFKHLYDAGTIGTGTYKFRHYSQQEPSSGETWVLNDVIGDYDKTFFVNFSSNGIEYSSINLSNMRDKQFMDYVQGSIGTSVYEDGTWTNQAYRTITFATAPTGDLLTWLQANGTKQGGDNVIKAGTYRWKAILPKPSQSFGQELVAKVYDLQTAGVRATKMPEANIEYIGVIVGAEAEISQMQELGDTTINATLEIDDWNTEQYSGMGNQNLQIIVFENDQQVSQEFYDYAITDGNLQALTNWTPHSYFSYILNDRYDVTVNGKTESQGYELKQGDIIRVAASGDTPYTVHFATISDSGAMSKNTAYTVVDEDIHLYTDKDLMDSTGAIITYQK